MGFRVFLWDLADSGEDLWRIWGKTEEIWGLGVLTRGLVYLGGIWSKMGMI